MALGIKVTVKLDAFNERFNRDISALIKELMNDAVEYVARKIREEMISGQYVGVITGNLRAGTKHETKDYNGYVFSEMDYTKYVLAWSKGKYGESYAGMAMQLYSGNVVTTFKEEVAKFYQKKYTYRNPFA